MRNTFSHFLFIFLHSISVRKGDKRERDEKNFLEKGKRKRERVGVGREAEISVSQFLFRERAIVHKWP